MKLLRNCLMGLRYKHWTFIRTLTYFLQRVEKKIVGTSFFEKRYVNIMYKHDINNYNQFLSVDVLGSEYLKIGNVKMTSLNTLEDKCTFLYIWEDIFMSYLYHNDSYEKSIFSQLDKFLNEGLYGYQDENIDVTIKSNDVVIDAGAWAGEYSAYCACKGAKVYAFEPSSQSYELLERTSALNENRIIPIKMGLGNECATFQISIGNAAGNLIVEDTMKNDDNTEPVVITTLDTFIEENGIEKVDFLKADIEGYERKFLEGAKSTIQKFLPKIAICTYHLPDDAEVLETLIKDCNPNYKIVHSRHKLFAQCLSSLPFDH